MQQIYNILLSFFRLKDIEKRFNNHKCSKENSVSASNKEGHGASSKDFVAHFPPPLGTQGLDDQKQCIINDPQAIDQNDQRNGPILGKETLISNQSQGPAGKKIDNKPNICTAKSDLEILQLIWKRHQLKAAKLLRKLKNIPSISWDAKGVIKLNGELLENSNIVDFIEVVFYSGKSKEIKHLSSWIAFLKLHGLFQFVINPKILIADYKDNWFFLGHLE